MKSFNLVSLYLRELSKCSILKFKGKNCSYLILSLIIGRESVRLGIMSRQFVNAKLIAKYIINFVTLLSHAAIDSNKWWLATSILQIHRTLLFTKT